jgi:hypothetical protein
MEQRIHDRPAATEHPDPNPYEKIQIPPQHQSPQVAPSSSQPSRKPSWAARIRSWRPWRR